MNENDIMMMKVLRQVKDKYYPNKPTYFDADLEMLEKRYKEENNVKTTR